MPSRLDSGLWLHSKDRNCPLVPLPAQGREGGGTPSCSLSDSRTVFVVLWLNAVPEVGLGGCGAWLLLFITPGTGKDVTNVSLGTARRRPPRTGSPRWGTFQPSTPQVTQVLPGPHSDLGASLEMGKLRHGSWKHPPWWNLNSDPGCWVPGQHCGLGTVSKCSSSSWSKLAVVLGSKSKGH